MKLKKLLVCALAATLLVGTLASCASTEGASSDSSSSASESSEDTSSTDTSEGEEATEETYEALFQSDYYTEDGYFKDLTASDYVTFEDYSALKVPEDVITVDESIVDAEIDGLVQGYVETAPMEDLEYVIQDGDTLNIDYVGSVDGVEFEGGSTGGAGTEVTIGVTAYIDGFLDQLIGHKAGETFDINVTFPADYSSADLAGKDAVFNITINSVMESIVPEFTDEFITEVSAGEFTTAESYKQVIRDSVMRSQRSEYLEAELSAIATFSEVPAVVTDYIKAVTEDQILVTAQSYGMEATDIIAQYGFDTMEAFLESESATIEAQAKQLITIQAIAEQNEIVVSTQDVNDYFGGLDWTSYKDAYGENYLKNVTLTELVYEFFS